MSHTRAVDDEPGRAVRGWRRYQRLRPIEKLCIVIVVTTELAAVVLLALPSARLTRLSVYLSQAVVLLCLVVRPCLARRRASGAVRECGDRADGSAP